MVCDWLFAGDRRDILNLFAVDNYPQQYIEWFSSGTRPKNDPCPNWTSRYYAETYIWYSFVKRTLPVTLEHSSDNTPENVRKSEEILAKNIIMLTADQAGVASSKYALPMDYHYSNYSYREWLKLVELHRVTHSLPRPLLDLEKLRAYCFQILFPRLNYWRRVALRPLVRLRRWMFEGS